jgi:ABC-type lipoprotein release transport system permease subunit
MASYSVSKRMREQGIRMALGAQRLQVMRFTLSRPILILLGGACIGGVLAVHLLAQLISFPSTNDPLLLRGHKTLCRVTRSDPLIHRSVAGAVNRLVDFLEAERKCVPGDVLRDAERLECLLFSGYDPHFEGDEPPGL